MNNRLKAAGRASDQGFTMIEMLVVMGLSSLLLVMVGRGFLQNFQTMGQAQSRSEVTVRIQNALEAMSRDIRVADPVFSGDANSLTVDVLRGGKCLRRTWALTGTTVTSTTLTYPGPCGDPAVTPTTTTDSHFLNNVGNGTAPTTAVFTYANHSGGSATATTSGQITVQLVGTVNGGAPVKLQTVVDLRNA